MKDRKTRKKVVLGLSVLAAGVICMGLVSCGAVSGTVTVPVEGDGYKGEIEVEFGGK